jgi:hypothetical protein
MGYFVFVSLLFSLRVPKSKPGGVRLFVGDPCRRENITGAKENGFTQSVLTKQYFTRHMWDEVKGELAMESFLE